MLSFPLLLTLYAGFSHAFEADHLLAISNIVFHRNSIAKAIKDGIFWGIGHTSTIMIVAAIMLILRVQIHPAYFHYLEACVGVMLVGLGFYRLYTLKPVLTKKKMLTHSHQHLHPLCSSSAGAKKLHWVSYGIGLVHGLAGSGPLVLLVTLQIASPQHGLLYLLIFGLGSIIGMLAAAAMFSLPFSKKVLQARLLQVILILISSTLSIAYGSSVMFQSLLAAM